MTELIDGRLIRVEKKAGCVTVSTYSADHRGHTATAATKEEAIGALLTGVMKWERGEAIEAPSADGGWMYKRTGVDSYEVRRVR